MEFVFGISGKIGSGKTSFSKALGDLLGVQQVSFGDFVRSVASQRNISPTRKNLQAIGQSLIEANAYDFCQNVLYSKGWDKESGLIIDGIRHIDVFNILKTKVQPLKFFLIYLDVSNEIRIERTRLANLSSVDRHKTEDDVKIDLPTVADLTINANLSIPEMLNIFCDWLKERNP